MGYGVRDVPVLDTRFDDDDVTVVRKLKSGKSPGPDGIHAELLKKTEAFVCAYLHKLFSEV